MPAVVVAAAVVQEAEANASTGVIAIPMTYRPPGGSAAQESVRLLVFDLGTSTFLSDTYYVVTDGVFGQLIPQAGSTMHARVAYLSDPTVWSRTWVDFTANGAFDASTPIGLEFFTLPQGAAFFAGLRAASAGGQGGWIATNVAPAPTKP